MGVTRRARRYSGEVTGVLGLQRGDEGKGRFVDELAQFHAIVARFNGGANAGHTVLLPDDLELDLHLVPSGIAHDGIMNVIGSGCYVDPVKLMGEFYTLNEKGILVTPEKLQIDEAAHLILPSHIAEDIERESGDDAQGSTGSGIAQVARDKYHRVGLQIGDALALGDLEIKQKFTAEYARSLIALRAYVDDLVPFLNGRLNEGDNILAEGAQAYQLDIDHGPYPFVTSSTTTSGGIATGLGIPPQAINEIYGVVKATQSHVGGGPFVTEIFDEVLLDRLRGLRSAVDGEYGTTTGRKRRMGHLDLPQLRRAIMVDGVTQVVLTKLDCLPRYGEVASVCVSYGSNDLAPRSARKLAVQEPVYEEMKTWKKDISSVRNFEDLPEAARHYVEFVEAELETPITRIGVGPQRDQMIKRAA